MLSGTRGELNISDLEYSSIMLQHIITEHLLHTAALLNLIGTYLFVFSRWATPSVLRIAQVLRL